MTDHRRFLILDAGAIDFGVADDERVEVDRHLATCPDCGHTSRRLRQQAIRVRDRPRALPPAEMRNRVAVTWQRGDRRGPEDVFRLVLLVVAVLLAIVALASVGAGIRRPIDAFIPSPVPAPSAPVVPPTTLPTIGTVTVKDLPAGSAAHERLCSVVIESGCATDIVEAFGSVWTTTTESVVRLDPGTGETVAEIPVGRFPLRFAEADGSLWVTAGDPGTLVRIDPDRNVVVGSVDIGTLPAGLASGGGSLWVAEQDTRSIVRVDPATMAVVDRLALEAAPWDVAATTHGIWVTDRYAETLTRIDPVTGSVVASVPIPGANRGSAWDFGDGMVVDRDRMWIASAGSLVSAYDAASGSFTSEIAPVFPHLASHRDGLWLISGANHLLQRLDPATMEPIAQQTIPLTSPTSGGDWETTMVVTSNAVWIRSYGDDRVIRVSIEEPGASPAP